MSPHLRFPRRALLRHALAASAAVAVPGLVRAQKTKPLVVGGLPVTCNLTLPVACVARQAANARDKSGAP